MIQIFCCCLPSRIIYALATFNSLEIYSQNSRLDLNSLVHRMQELTVPPWCKQQHSWNSQRESFLLQLVGCRLSSSDAISTTMRRQQRKIGANICGSFHSFFFSLLLLLLDFKFIHNEKSLLFIALSCNLQNSTFYVFLCYNYFSLFVSRWLCDTAASAS